MRPIIIRDLRQKEKFQIDDAYLNGYARLVKCAATAIYMSLCRHADKEQKSFPSVKLLAQEHSMNISTAQRAIKKLQNYNIIHYERTRSGKGKWLNNTYFLQDKSVWLTTGQKRPMDKPQGKNIKTTGQKPSTKDTHKKDTHTLTKVKEEFGNSSINEGMDLLTAFFGYKPSKIPLNRYALHRLIKSRGEERVFKAMEFALSQQSNRYCPVVTSYMDLEQKWADLEVYARREFSSPKKGGVVDASHL